MPLSLSRLEFELRSFLCSSLTFNLSFKRSLMFRSRSHFREFRLKSVKVLLVRLDCKCLNLGAFNCGFKEHAKGYSGLAGLLGKGGGYLEWRTGNMIEHDPFGFHDVDKHDIVLVVRAVGSMHDKSPGATRRHVKFLKSIGKTLRSPPPSEMFRICPRLPDELTRPIDHACVEDLQS